MPISKKISVSKKISKKKKMMKKSENPIIPPWQDLDPFILAQIFTHLPLHDTLFGPPFVCRSWLCATLNTLFKNSNLDLTSIQNLDDVRHQKQYTHLLRLAIKHYNGWVSVTFPPKNMPDFSTIMYVAENTPKISRVILPPNASVNVYPIFISVMYWKNLRVFRAPIRKAMGFQFMTQLVDYCKNIVELGVHGDFMEREVSCIIEGFPGLKVLDFSESTLSAKALIMVLDGRLKCIKEINVMHCLFVDEDGKDMRNDYARFRGFKNDVLEKVKEVKSLKKFMHCLGRICDQCKDRSLEDK